MKAIRFSELEFRKWLATLNLEFGRCLGIDRDNY